MLKKVREEMEAFRDANAQEYPVAERLEEIARVEIRYLLFHFDVFHPSNEIVRVLF